MDSSPYTYTVTFSVECEHSAEERLVVVGDRDSMGAWNVAEGKIAAPPLPLPPLANVGAGSCAVEQWLQYQGLGLFPPQRVA